MAQIFYGSGRLVEHLTQGLFWVTDEGEEFFLGPTHKEALRRFRGDPKQKIFVSHKGNMRND